jgi:hypothetical protein
LWCWALSSLTTWLILLHSSTWNNNLLLQDRMATPSASHGEAPALLQTAKRIHHPLELQLLKELGVDEYIVQRSHRLTRAKGSDDLPIVMLVHHREFYVGCHSFERFINLRWETIFVLERDLVEQFQLERLGQTTTTGEPGCSFCNSEFYHIFGRMARQKGGSVDNGIHFAEAGTSHGIHPLPTWHKQHVVSFEKQVSRMVVEFLNEDKLNHDQQTNVNEYNHRWSAPPLNKRKCEQAFSSAGRPLFVMNTVLCWRRCRLQMI